MTYTMPDNLKKLTEYLSAYLMAEIGETTISTAAYEAIQGMMAKTLQNGLAAFFSGASPTGLCYEVQITAEDADKLIVFEAWSVRYIQEEMNLGEYSRTDLPTLFRMNDEQFIEVLEHCVRKGYSFYCSTYGLMLSELEGLAERYFEKYSVLAAG